jgi:hypothetical protein
MLKAIGLACASLLLLPSASPNSSQFSAYKAVEAYEIRPGILMMPRFTESGQVCEIGIQKRNYSPELVRLDSSLSRKEIDQIFEEIVPANERGPKSTDPLLEDLITLASPGITETIDFENISINIYAEALSGSNKRKIITSDAIVATVQWKNRKCL